MNLLKTILFFLFILLFAACSSNSSENVVEISDSIPTYIIQKPDSFARIDSLTGDTTLVDIEYYYDFNIILIDSLSQIYYHRKRWVCGGCVGNQLRSNLPDFIGLMPDQIIREDSLNVVLRDLFINGANPKYIYLISNKDSIIDPRYFALKDSLLKRNIHVSTRLLTEEETNVLFCLLNNRVYHSDDYLWDSTNMMNVLEIDIKDEKLSKTN